MSNGGGETPVLRTAWKDQICAGFQYSICLAHATLIVLHKDAMEISASATDSSRKLVAHHSVSGSVCIVQCF